MSKKVKYILRSAIQILWSNRIYAVDDDSNWCVLVICLQISHLGLLQETQKPSSVLSVDTLVLPGCPLNSFSFLKPITGKFSKTFLCSLSDIKKR